MFLEDVVPKNSNKQLPDRLWATYSALVWGCNSLNAYGGRFIRMASSEEPINISTSEAESVWVYMNRAQEIILALLNETGRLKELDEWEKEQLARRSTNAIYRSESVP